MATKSKATKAAGVKVETTKVEAADRDAVFGRYMLTLGQVVRGVQRMLDDPEFGPITNLSGNLCVALVHFNDVAVGGYEPLLTAYAESPEDHEGATG